MKRAIKLTLYYFAYQLAFTFLVGIPASLAQLFQNTTQDASPEALTGQLPAQAMGLVMVLSGLAMVWHLIHFGYVKFNRNSWTELPVRTLLLTVPLTVSAMFFFNILSEFIELPNLLENTFAGMSRNVLGILSIAVMAPLVEELLFRGAIQGHLQRSGKSPRTAILLSSLIFGLIHVNPAQVPFAFCIGLVFGWLYYRTGSVIPGMLGHFLNNSIATLIMATSTKEEMNQKTIDLLGPTATYSLLILSAVVFIGMYFYLNRQLPQGAPQAPVAPSEES